MDTVILYRPVGPNELKLIRESGWKAFPPRLPGQPIFYPVTNAPYAAQIARDWNVKASGAGFVTASSKQFRNEEFGEEFDGGVAAGLPEYRAARIRPPQ